MSNLTPWQHTVALTTHLRHALLHREQTHCSLGCVDTCRLDLVQTKEEIKLGLQPVLDSFSEKQY